AEDGIRYWSVTGVQTCALPISQLLAALEVPQGREALVARQGLAAVGGKRHAVDGIDAAEAAHLLAGRRVPQAHRPVLPAREGAEIGRASCRERRQIAGRGVERR